MAESDDMEKKLGVGVGGKDGDFMEGMAVLDFDMLCATVALQSQSGFVLRETQWGTLNDDDDANGVGVGGVQRLWEGEVLDCFEDRRIVVETLCCPCYRFGKNMRRAGFGSCFIQGAAYFIITVIAFLNYIAFAVTGRHCFLYLAVVFTISDGIYLGFFRRQIRKQFNIKASIFGLAIVRARTVLWMIA
ncbi:hypothetical protein GIB67_014646 [Kingdonia uniflora]|uniref:PLAC8 family protein n=1 Tax=Kingdonia uniflora TaxID=39325 RepID=A0A7J7LY35_9MAGN|nr:hypothetical protein GIB67_014646 [Kingdonia uniflora]